MFDFAWSELMVIGAVALVVIGPKDLPKALKTAGILVRRARGMAREFQNSVEDMIREAELDDVRKTVQEATRFDLDKKIQNTIDPDGQLRQPLIAEPATPAPAALAKPEPAADKPLEAVASQDPPPLSEPFIAPRIPPAP
jgi:sec-independent protein translocase protein TatB